MRRPKEIITNEWTALNVIVGEVMVLARAHPKKAFIVIVFHVWVYGLALHHIHEIKDIVGLIPFIN